MIQIGSRETDIRYDPLLGDMIPIEILGTSGVGNAEVHQVTPIPGLPGRFGFSPNEMPMRRSDIVDSGIILYEVDSNNNLTGFSASGDALIQVRPPLGGEPSPNEYAVDFNNSLNYLNTGRFFFNPLDNGKYYRIHRYYGLGSLNSVRNTMFIEDLSLIQKLSRNGTLPMTGDLNFGNNRGINVSNGIDGLDIVNLNQLQATSSAFNSSVNHIQNQINTIKYRLEYQWTWGNSLQTMYINNPGGNLWIIWFSYDTPPLPIDPAHPYIMNAIYPGRAHVNFTKQNNIQIHSGGFNYHVVAREL